MRSKPMHPAQAREIARLRSADASFARSFDPRASNLTLHSRATGGGEAFVSVSRLGKPARAGGTNTGAGRMDVARLAASHRFREEEGVGRQKRKEVEASVPARNRELRFGCSHVVFSLQKSVGGVWSQIRSAHALQKERSGSSERGPSPGRRSAVHTVGSRVGRKDRCASASPRRRERTGARPRVA